MSSGEASSRDRMPQRRESGDDLASSTHYPESVAEVIALVKQAALEGRQLYPVSTGLNWGYGDDRPPQPGCELVRLSRMNRIRNEGSISLRNPVAVIEPGVTQGQLHAFLVQRCPELTFNVTGSARDTSIIGNSLDRGAGYLGSRCEDLFALEVVLGSGQLIQTGFRRLGEASPLAHVHPHGLGPMLDGLFFQGNFGIVTSACFRLVPRRPVHVALSMRLLKPTLAAAFVDEVCCMKRDGLLPAAVHVGNRLRTHATLERGAAEYLSDVCGVLGSVLAEEVEAALRFAAPAEWSGFSAVQGNAGQVKASVSEIKQRLRGLARVMVVDGRKLEAGYALLHRSRWSRAARVRAAAIASIRPLLGLSVGMPTDVAVQSLFRDVARAADAASFNESKIGLIYVSPALPSDGVVTMEIVSQMNTLAQDFGHELYVTLNFESADGLVAVTNIVFDKLSGDATGRATRCAQALEVLVRQRGLELYRARSAGMDQVVSGNPAYWSVVRSLKLALDPSAVISPGRYGLPT